MRKRIVRDIACGRLPRCRYLALRLRALLVVWLLAPLTAAHGAGRPEVIEVPLNKSVVLNLDRNIRRVAMGNDNIADIMVIGGSQLYVLGKQLGTTNVLMWDNSGQLVKAMDISVLYDLNSLKEKLALLLPEERVEVYSSQGALILSGQISSLANMNSALQIANSFVSTAEAEITSGAAPDSSGTSAGGGAGGGGSVGDKVINLMTIGGSQQVMIKVTVAELSRNTAKKLGVQFHSINQSGSWTTGAVNGGAGFPSAGAGRLPSFGGPIVGPLVKQFVPASLGIADKGLFASYLGEDFLFNMTLEAAKDSGMAKILAEPTLTALSGQSAKFLSGGEFPIPVPQGGNNNAVTIQFKEFGVGVNFVPIVLNSGAINLKLNVSVTEITDTTTVVLGGGDSSESFFVPSLSSRSTSTTVELGDGQTIGIAGLISENMRSAVTKFPGLGDIPILGQLFRSQQFEKGESELVIMVTPYLATPVNNKLATLPTDSFVEPSDWSFYLLGKTFGRGTSSQRAGSGAGLTATATRGLDDGLISSTIGGYSGGVDGKFGHTVE